MAILAEYALTPDIFDVTSYSNNDEICDLHIQKIKDVLIQEGLIRNLRDGKWMQLFADDNRPWHRRGKELLKKLVKQSRIIDRKPFGKTAESVWLDNLPYREQSHHLQWSRCTRENSINSLW